MDGVGRNLVAIGVGYGDGGSCGGEGFREDVACLFGADEKHFGAGCVGRECCG